MSCLGELRELGPPGRPLTTLLGQTHELAKFHFCGGTQSDYLKSRTAVPSRHQRFEYYMILIVTQIDAIYIHARSPRREKLLRYIADTLKTKDDNELSWLLDYSLLAYFIYT